MRLVFLGPPGSGKGTQAGMVSGRFGIPQISTGDILREAIEQNKELGTRARGYVEGGKLVPDEIVLSLVEERTAKPDCTGGFILDGFPRTLVQAEGLEKILADHGAALDAVIFIDVGDEAIISRLSRRRVCPTCGAPYNIDSDPPREEGVCDKCGGKLEARVDDAPATVKTRLEVYRKDTLPLVKHYESEGLLKRVSGEGTVEGVFSSILAELEAVRR
jgi:adenylate kinase